MKRLLLTLAALLFAAAPLSAQRAVRVDNPTGALTEPANLWTANAAGIATGLTGSGFGGGATAAGYLGGYRVEQYPPNFAAYSIPFWINDDQWVTWVETSEALGLLGLGSAATRDVGTAEGNLVEIDGFGGITLTGPISAPGGLDAGQSQFSQVITPQLRATGISGLITVPTVSGTLLLADGNGGSLTNLNASNLASGTIPSARLPSASETVVGGLEIATAAEIAAGTDNTRAVSPLGLHGYLDPIVASRAPVDMHYSDGTTPNRGIIHTLGTDGNVAGSPLSVWIKGGVVPTVTAAGWLPFGLSSLTTTAFTPHSLGVLSTNGTDLRIRALGATTGDFRAVDFAGFRTTYAGRPWNMVIVFGANTSAAPTVYWDGVDISSSFVAASPTGTPPNWMSTDLIATHAIAGLAWPAAGCPLAIPINRALTAGEIATMIQFNALLPQDRLGGSMKLLTDGRQNFEDGTTVWSVGSSGGGTIAVTNSADFARSGTRSMKLQRTGASSTGYFAATLSAPLRPGVIHDAVGYLYIPSGQAGAAGLLANWVGLFLGLADGTGSVEHGVQSRDAIAFDTWIRVQKTGFQPSLSSSLSFLFGFITAAPIDAVFYVDDISLSARGALLQPEITRTAQLLDHGPNRLRGICTAGIRPLTDRDPQPLRGSQAATGMALGLGASDPIWYEPATITGLRIKQATASAQTITLRLDTSGGTVIATATTAASTAWQTVALSNPGGFEVAAGNRLHWTITNAIDWDLTWTLR